MAILSPGDLFQNTIPVAVGEDVVELHNPTVEDVADIRAGFVAVIQEVCTYPYDDALELLPAEKDEEGNALTREPKYPAVYEYLNRELIPAMRDIMWQSFGMPGDDRAYRAVLARMSVEQQAVLQNAYIETAGMDAVFDAARRSGDKMGNT